MVKMKVLKSQKFMRGEVKFRITVDIIFDDTQMLQLGSKHFYQMKITNTI